MNYHLSILLDNGTKSLFLQGSSSEQRLVQSLINEQLKMYGVEVTYIPRKLINVDNIFTEVESSKFDDNYSIEHTSIHMKDMLVEGHSNKIWNVTER